MGAYLLRRLAWMIPTFLGILIINFGVLRLRSGSLHSEMYQATGGNEAGTRDARSTVGALENYVAQFRRASLDLPALVNPRGFLDKDDLIAWLKDTERAEGVRESDRARAETALWLGGELIVEPLLAVLADDRLAEYHGPAGKALWLSAFRPLAKEDLDHLSNQAIARIRARNRILKNHQIDFRNTLADGFVSVDPEAEMKRQALLAPFSEGLPVEFRRDGGRAWSALVLETGFIDFLSKLATGQLYSEDKKRYVFDLIAERWYVTFWLNLAAVCIAWFGAIPLGIRSARRDGSLEDTVTTNVLFLLWSMPSFFIASLFLHHLCTDGSDAVALFPNAGLASRDNLWFSTPGYLLDLLWHSVLPLIVLTYASFTALSRYMRGNLLDQLSSDYVRTARAKGATDDRVVYGHAVPNSLVTMITLGGGLLGELFASSIIVEYIFSIPGLSMLLLDAAIQQDAPLVMGATVIQVALMLLGILIADLLYAVVDPRIRSRYA